MKMTTLCYIEKDGKYLMLHRTKRKKILIRTNGLVLEGMPRKAKARRNVC